MAPTMPEDRELVKRASSLKKVHTKEFDGPAAEDIKAIAHIFKERQGDLKALSEHFHISQELLQESRPADAEDFAKKLLQGLYLVDKDAKAQARFRENLQIEIMRTSSKLKKSDTKEFDGVVSEAEVLAAAKLYKANGGDLELLAKACGLSWEVLVERPPTDATDFGTNLLQGHYSVDTSEAAKAKLREVLSQEVGNLASGLKKAVRKESFTEPSEQHVEALAKIWDEKGSVEELAKNWGLSLSVLQQRPPEDAQDFARKAFLGAYTAVGTEFTKAEFRKRLEDELGGRMGKLKSTSTNRPRSATEDDLFNFGKFFNDKNGNLAAIAAATGLSKELLEMFPPEDATDFAQKLLAGVYSQDKSEHAKQQMRSRMRREIESTKGTLRKTSTKVWDGKASEDDVRLFAQLYADNAGDLEALARKLSLDLAMLREHRPTSADDFAQRLLSGGYTPEYVAIAAKAMRDDMVRNIKEDHMPKLRHTETRSSLAGPQPGDVALVARVYNELNGDIKKLATYFQADDKSMVAAGMQDANEFAIKLLSGTFADAEQETSRGKLRELLEAGLKRRPSLRASVTKEALGQPREEDIVGLAKQFELCKGDLAEVAKMLYCNAAVLKQDAPADGRKFAVKYLQGFYRPVVVAGSLQ